MQRYRFQINYFSGMYADVMTVAVTESGAKNLVYVSNTEPGRSMTAVDPDSAQTAGSVACYAGYASGWQCGSIIATNQQIVVNGLTMYRQWEVNVGASSGDSGAPVFYGSHERGLLHTTVVGQAASYYSTIDGIRHDLPSISPCLSSGC